MLYKSSVNLVLKAKSEYQSKQKVFYGIKKLILVRNL